MASWCRLDCKKQSMSQTNTRRGNDGGAHGPRVETARAFLTYLDLLEHRFTTKQQRWRGCSCEIGASGSPSERAGGGGDAPSDVHAERNGAGGGQKNIYIIHYACV